MILGEFTHHRVGKDSCVGTFDINRGMTDKMIISDPDVVETKETDGSGRLYLGKDYANVEVRAVIKITDKTPGDEDDE